MKQSLKWLGRIAVGLAIVGVGVVFVSQRDVEPTVTEMGPRKAAPQDTPEPASAQVKAEEEASEFGMIGLLAGEATKERAQPSTPHQGLSLDSLPRDDATPAPARRSYGYRASRPPSRAPSPAPAPKSAPAPAPHSGPESFRALLAEDDRAPRRPSSAPASAPAMKKGKPKLATKQDLAQLRARRAMERSLDRAAHKDEARRADDRAALVPRDGDDRFAELSVLGQSTLAEMTYNDYGVNPTISTAEESVSTFAVDVDSASFGVARSYLQKGQMPPEGAIRVEEMINAFDYAYAAPDKEPFLVQAEIFPSPNRKGYHVLHVGVKGRELPPSERKPTSLVFVVDVSGSMEGESRLGLVKRSLTMLTRQLDGRDSVGVVVYGSDARTVLEPTRATESGKGRIVQAISGLSTEGSTNVEAGLDLGYAMAGQGVSRGVNSRVILCSDGVANTGATSAEAILARVASQAGRGVTISTVGFGMGTYNDTLMERLADQGNGNYAYVDNIDAATRVFVDQLGATLEVIAKDVKIQVAFDEHRVSRYRLLGFENRVLDKRDFADDRVDAGEIGAGHTVTAIYEIKLTGRGGDGDVGELRLRYKTPNGTTSRLLSKGMPASIVRGSYAEASAPTKLSMVVAAFAEKLRGSYWARNESYGDILSLWSQMPDSLKRRQDVAELRSLIVTARSLDGRTDRFEPLLPVAKMDFDRVPVLN